MPTPDDIWYAIAHTEVILPPRRKLETFGNTIIHYHLVAETMDSVNEVRVREGRVHAERPQVLTPHYFEQLLLDGFGGEAGDFTHWLRDHVKDLAFLKYGFRFRKEETSESVVHETLEAVTERVASRVGERGDPLAVVIQGVDDPWEICLLKFVTDTIRASAPGNFQELKERRMLEEIAGVPRAVREEIAGDFDAVGSNREKMKNLGAKLRHYGLFEAYEDRFFELVRRLSS